MKAICLKSAQAELDAAIDYYADHASERVAEAFLQDALLTRQRATLRACSGLKDLLDPFIP